MAQRTPVRNPLWYGIRQSRPLLRQVMADPQVRSPQSPTPDEPRGLQRRAPRTHPVSTNDRGRGLGDSPQV